MLVLYPESAHRHIQVGTVVVDIETIGELAEMKQ